MFTQEQLEGVIYSLAYPEIEITKDDRQSIGYRIRLRVNFRAKNNLFLLKLQRTLQCLANSESIDTSKLGDAQSLKDKEILEFLGDN